MLVKLAPSLVALLALVVLVTFYMLDVRVTSYEQCMLKHVAGADKTLFSTIRSTCLKLYPPHGTK